MLKKLLSLLLLVTSLVAFSQVNIKIGSEILNTNKLSKGVFRFKNLNSKFQHGRDEILRTNFDQVSCIKIGETKINSFSLAKLKLQHNIYNTRAINLDSVQGPRDQVVMNSSKKLKFTSTILPFKETLIRFTNKLSKVDKVRNSKYSYKQKVTGNNKCHSFTQTSITGPSYKDYGQHLFKSNPSYIPSLKICDLNALQYQDKLWPKVPAVFKTDFNTVPEFRVLIDGKVAQNIVGDFSVDNLNNSQEDHVFLDLIDVAFISDKQNYNLLVDNSEGLTRVFERRIGNTSSICDEFKYVSEISSNVNQISDEGLLNYSNSIVGLFELVFKPNHLGTFLSRTIKVSEKKKLYPEARLLSFGIPIQDKFSSLVSTNRVNCNMNFDVKNIDIFKKIISKFEFIGSKVYVNDTEILSKVTSIIDFTKPDVLKVVAENGRDYKTHITSFKRAKKIKCDNQQVIAKTYQDNPVVLGVSASTKEGLGVVCKSDDTSNITSIEHKPVVVNVTDKDKYTFDCGSSTFLDKCINKELLTITSNNKKVNHIHQLPRISHKHSCLFQNEDGAILTKKSKIYTTDTRQFSRPENFRVDVLGLKSGDYNLKHLKDKLKIDSLDDVFDLNFLLFYIGNLTQNALINFNCEGLEPNSNGKSSIISGVLGGLYRSTTLKYGKEFIEKNAKVFENQCFNYGVDDFLLCDSIYRIRDNGIMRRLYKKSSKPLEGDVQIITLSNSVYEILSECGGMKNIKSASVFTDIYFPLFSRFQLNIQNLRYGSRDKESMILPLPIDYLSYGDSKKIPDITLGQRYLFYTWSNDQIIKDLRIDLDVSNSFTSCYDLSYTLPYICYSRFVSEKKTSSISLTNNIGKVNRQQLLTFVTLNMNKREIVFSDTVTKNAYINDGVYSFHEKDDSDLKLILFDSTKNQEVDSSFSCFFRLFGGSSKKLLSSCSIGNENTWSVQEDFKENIDFTSHKYVIPEFYGKSRSRFKSSYITKYRSLRIV